MCPFRPHLQQHMSAFIKVDKKLVSSFDWIVKYLEQVKFLWPKPMCEIHSREVQVWTVWLMRSAICLKCGERCGYAAATFHHDGTQCKVRRTAASCGYRLTFATNCRSEPVLNCRELDRSVRSFFCVGFWTHFNLSWTTLDSWISLLFFCSYFKKAMICAYNCNCYRIFLSFTAWHRRNDALSCIWHHSFLSPPPHFDSIQIGV